jgi:hypothetical protein
MMIPRITEAALPRTFITDLYAERNAKGNALFARLPGLDIEAALAGAPCVHRFDLPNVKPYHDFRRIAEPHGGYLVWLGEWCTYSGDNVIEELKEYLRMYDPLVLGGAEVK